MNKHGHVVSALLLSKQASWKSVANKALPYILGRSSTPTVARAVKGFSLLKKIDTWSGSPQSRRKFLTDAASTGASKTLDTVFPKTPVLTKNIPAATSLTTANKSTIANVATGVANDLSRRNFLKRLAFSLGTDQSARNIASTATNTVLKGPTLMSDGINDLAASVGGILF